MLACHQKKCSVQNQNLRISSISLSFQHPWIFPLEMVGTPAKEHFVFSDQIMRFTTVRLTKLVERSCIQTMRPMYLGKPRFARFSLHFQVWPWNVKKNFLWHAYLENQDPDLFRLFLKCTENPSVSSELWMNLCVCMSVL